MRSSLSKRMRCRFAVVALLVGVLGLPGLVQAADYFVSASGSASWAECRAAGTPCSIVTAFANAAAGDTVYLRGGTYTLAAHLVTAHSGTEAAPIRVAAYPGETPVVTGDSLSRLMLIENPYWQIDGLTMTITNMLDHVTAIIGVGHNGNAQHFTLTRSSLHVISVNGQDNTSCIYLGGGPRSSNALIQDNVFEGNGVISGWGINCVQYLGSGNVGSKILNNEMHHAAKGVYVKHNTLDTASTGGEIAYNFLYSVSQAVWGNPIYLDIHDNLIVGGNIELGNNGGGLQGANCKIRHNTVYKSTATDALDLQYPSEGPITYTTVTDNVFMKRASVISGSGSLPHYNTMDYNLYITGTAAIREYLVNYSLAGWQAKSGMDAHSIAGAPVFVGGASPSAISDYALASGSPGKNAASDGRDLGADVAQVGVRLSGGGAADRTPPTAPGPPVAVVVSPTQVDLSWGAASDNVAVSGYRVFRGATQVATSTATSWADQSLSPSTTVTYSVEAYDAAGNVSGPSPTATATTPAAGDVSGLCGDWQRNHPEWIFCDDFESTGPLVASGRYFDYDDNGGVFIPVDGVGYAGSRGMRTVWHAGDVSAGGFQLTFGRNPMSTSALNATQDYRDIYYRLYLKNQAGWQGNPGKLSRAIVFSGSDWSQAAIAHIWGNDATHLAVDPVSCVSGGTAQCQGYNDFAHFVWLGAANGTTPLFDGSHNDRWYCVEAHMKLNDSGVLNGVQEFWIDGNLEARKAALNFVGSYTSYGINAVFVENYWNAGAPRQQERYFDNFVVSTQRIGCVDTTPPRVPSGLRGF